MQHSSTVRRLLHSLGLFLLSACSAAAADRPNILWLVSEDNTTLLGCYGDPLARTPTLDKLALDGVLFERCFAQPVCAPARFTLITGTFAASSGPANHMRAQGQIPDWLKGFPALLRAAGYFTANNAKTDYNAPINIKENWSESGKSAHYRDRPNPEQPFFSVFNHEVTHESCLFPEQDKPLNFQPTDPAKVRVPPYQPDTSEVRADWARYYDHLALLDQQIAAKLKELEKAGLAEDTIIFYYADNGGVLARSKRFLQASGTHVPLIAYFPPKWRHLAPAAPGSRLTQPVSFVDFAPTVLSLAGVEIPGYMQGRAFAGPQAGTNDFVFCTRDRMDERYDMMRSVMDSRWLYIRNFRPDLPYVQPLDYMFRARGYQSWARLAAEGGLTPATAQFWGGKPAEELYDLAADLDNVKNLAADPAQRVTLERMRAALKLHTLEIVDNGFLPEGSSLQGYEPSRRPGAYPVERAFNTAELASERNPAHLTALLAALDDPSEPVRWWGAQGCTMLGGQAASAESLLRERLEDPSGAVQVAAAEALARLGQIEVALTVLKRRLQDTNNLAFALQAANVLDRLGESARPALPTMQRVFAEVSSTPESGRMEQYLQRILERIIAVLEGKSSALVYPPVTAGARSEASGNPLADALLERIPETFAFATRQYQFLLESLKGQTNLPRTFEKGELQLVRPKDWTSGFFPGSLWYLYEYTDQAPWKSAAQDYTARLEDIKDYGGSHDVGFMLNCSFGNGYRLTGDPHYREVLLQGARTLSTRFRPEVGLIRSWDHVQWQYPVIIDNMMNLELLTWASRESKDPRFREIAVLHADKTLTKHFRPDSSSWHVVDYDPTNGAILQKKTHQGSADSSAWARGQAWGLYGYTMMYRETGRPEYLAQAQKIARFLMYHPRLPADRIPYWDFDAPDIPNAPRDASAAAIMASALIELGQDVEPEFGRQCLGLARQQLLSLSSPAYLATVGENGGFLLRHCVGHMPKNSEVDVPINYADYYFLEALLRYRKQASREPASP